MNVQTIEEVDMADFRRWRGCLIDIIRQLYGREKLDVSRLDSDLCWLAKEFDIALPEGEPQIQRTKTQIFQFATELAQLQRFI